MALDLVPATKAQIPLVQELARFYIYEFSGAMGWDYEAEDAGVLYQCDDLSRFWAPGNHPFLIQRGPALAGFALVDHRGLDPATEHNMGEFFILRRYQRQGIGRQIALRLFERFPGRWEVLQMDGNAPAIAFWRAVIGAYTEGRYEETRRFLPENEKTHNVISFTAGAP